MITKIESIYPPVMQYTIDSSADAASLPHSGISAGSAAICIGSGEVYMFNGRTWELFGGDA